MRSLHLALLVPVALAAGGAARAQFVLADHVGGGLLGVDDVELTPDGRYAVARDNTVLTSARVYDLATGAELAFVPSSGGTVSGVAQDAVVCTDERAVVIGSRLLVLDLTNLAGPLLAEHAAGTWPRDVALTPDGTLAVVRGGSGPSGGLFVLDVQSGAVVAQAPGEPDTYTDFGFDVDSVVADDEHAVCTSYVSAGGVDRARVTVWDLHPAGGGPPAVVFETDAASDQLGAPHDVALTPDGQHAAVRAELDVALYRLDGASSTQVWRRRLFDEPGPFGGSALDSIEVTDTRVATISRWSNGGVGAQVDVFTVAGLQKYDRVPGDPHDLAIAPDGRRMVVRTSSEVLLYDLEHLGAGVQLAPLSSGDQPTTHTSWGAGLDSVAMNERFVVTMARQGATSDVRVWEYGGDQLALVDQHALDDEPVDLALTPAGAFAVATGVGHALVIDLRTGQAVLDHHVVNSASWPWCDGVVVNDAHAVAFGVVAPNFQGWLSVIDLFTQPAAYCTATPNSTGRPGQIFATGSASVAANDLALWAWQVPSGQLGRFVYGSGTAMTPFGNGFVCVGGSVFSFPPTLSGDGLAQQAVDYANLPMGGAIAAGSTWHFQYLHRDTVGAGFDLTGGLSVDFVP